MNTIQKADYRDSHQTAEKSEKYHDKFSNNPYRSMLWQLERDVLDSIIDREFGDRPATHLDFACGTGRVVNYLAPRTEGAFGVDISESMLEIARRENDEVTFVEGDLTRDNLLGDRSFSLITAFRFFPNAQPSLRSEALEALVKLMTDDGILVFNNHKNSSSIIYSIARLLRMNKPAMSHAEVVELMRSQGLAIKSVDYLAVVPSTEKYKLLPVSVLRGLEKVLSKVPGIRRLAANRVYVACRMK